MLNVLSLDPATKLGWAIYSESRLVSGVLDLSIKKGESDGIKWLKLEAWLNTMCCDYAIQLISAERVSGRHANAVIHHAKLLGIIEKFGVQHKIETKQYSATEIKKFATDKGTASKEDMINAAREQYDYEGSDDNEADSLHLLFLTKSQLQI